MADMNSPRYYRVRYGDTLTSLGVKFYDDERCGLIIYNNNRHYIDDPNMLYPGQMLVIPHVNQNETAFA